MCADGDAEEDADAVEELDPVMEADPDDVRDERAEAVPELDVEMLRSAVEERVGADEMEAVLVAPLDALEERDAMVVVEADVVNSALLVAVVEGLSLLDAEGEEMGDCVMTGEVPTVAVAGCVAAADREDEDELVVVPLLPADLDGMVDNVALLEARALVVGPPLTDTPAVALPVRDEAAVTDATPLAVAVWEALLVADALRVLGDEGEAEEDDTGEKVAEEDELEEAVAEGDPVGEAERVVTADLDGAGDTVAAAVLVTLRTAVRDSLGVDDALAVDMRVAVPNRGEADAVALTLLVRVTRPDAVDAALTVTEPDSVGVRVEMAVDVSTGDVPTVADGTGVAVERALEDAVEVEDALLIETDGWGETLPLPLPRSEEEGLPDAVFMMGVAVNTGGVGVPVLERDALVDPVTDGLLLVEVLEDGRMEAEGDADGAGEREGVVDEEGEPEDVMTNVPNTTVAVGCTMVVLGEAEDEPDVSTLPERTPETEGLSDAVEDVDGERDTERVADNVVDVESVCGFTDWDTTGEVPTVNVTLSDALVVAVTLLVSVSTCVSDVASVTLDDRVGVPPLDAEGERVVEPLDEPRGDFDAVKEMRDVGEVVTAATDTVAGTLEGDETRV